MPSQGHIPPELRAGSERDVLWPPPPSPSLATVTVTLAGDAVAPTHQTGSGRCAGTRPPATTLGTWGRFEDASSVINVNCNQRAGNPAGAAASTPCPQPWGLCPLLEQWGVPLSLLVTRSPVPVPTRSHGPAGPSWGVTALSPPRDCPLGWGQVPAPPGSLPVTSCSWGLELPLGDKGQGTRHLSR